MSEVVTVVHPALVRFVPRGGHKEHRRLEARRTPVQLTAAAPGDFEPVPPRQAGTPPLHAHAGRLWAPIEVVANVPAPKAEVAAFLRGTEATGPGSEMHGPFAGTPVCAHGPYMTTRGEELDLAAARHLIDDGAQAAARVQAFFDANIRIVGDVVHRRVDLVAHSSWPDFFLPAFAAQALPQGGLLAHPSHAHDLWTFERNLHGGRADARYDRSWGEFRGVLDGLPAHLVPEDADIRLTVNALVRAPLSRLNEIRSLRVKGASDKVREAEAALGPFIPDAMVGALEPDMLEPVLAAAWTAVGALQAGYPKQSSDYRALARYAEEVLLPRMRSMAPTADDAAALDGLGPGM